MKKIFLLMALALGMTSVNAAAQEDKQEDKALLKEEMKVIQQRIDSALYAEAAKAVNDTAFTLEADQVVFKYGQTAYVNSNTNFVAVNHGNAVVQVAFNVPFAGPNGIGGITVQGMVSKYELKTDKRGTTYVTMNVMGTGISAQVFITLYKGSHKASVEILPNFNSNRLTLNGVIVPSAKSNVYQGRTL